MMIRYTILRDDLLRCAEAQFETQQRRIHWVAWGMVLAVAVLGVVFALLFLLHEQDRHAEWVQDVLGGLVLPPFFLVLGGVLVVLVVRREQYAALFKWENTRQSDSYRKHLSEHLQKKVPEDACAGGVEFELDDDRGTVFVGGSENRHYPLPAMWKKKLSPVGPGLFYVFSRDGSKKFFIPIKYDFTQRQ